MDKPHRPSRTPGSRHGQVMFPMALSIIALAGLAGLGVDSVLLFIVKGTISSAVDSALLSAASAPSERRETVAQGMFDANFPNGYMMTSGRTRAPISQSGNILSMSARASVPTLLMRVLGRRFTSVSASAKVRLPSPELIIIDEDAIDNGTSTIQQISNYSPFCGNRNSAVCVNDDIAGFNVRTRLFHRNLDITPYSGLRLPTGQTGDWGLFRFTRGDPQVSLQNGAQFTRQEFINGTGVASNENNLDKIQGVKPLTAADITALVGKTVCAVVYDSDVSVDLSANYGVLKGATMGLTAFTVTGTVATSGLPNIVVNLHPVSEVSQTCSDAGAADASSKPVLIQ